MRSGWVGGAVAAALVAALGCGDEVGVLIEVTRDDSVPAALGRLELHVGVDGLGGEAIRFVDPAPEADVRLDGRDLATDPYRLLLRPRDYPDADVMVAALVYQSGDVVGFGALERPVGFVDGEVARWRIVLRGDLPDGLDATETGCLTWLDAGGERTTIGNKNDRDCDGWRAEDDCDDTDPRVNPSAAEVCGNDVDEDCDQAVDEDVDEDGDQVTTCGGDCDDGDPSVSPAAEEVCDGIDNDCDAVCDDGQDADGDTYTVCGSQVFEDGTCLFDPGLTDCDDGDPRASPGAEEVCDGIDNDCDFACDDGLDRDGDGFTECGSIDGHCGLSEAYADCEPEVGEIGPAEAEVCDGRDDDCDGELLQRGPCFAVDVDSGGCFLGERVCAEQPGEPTTWDGPCEPGLDPLFDAAPDAVCPAYDECDAVADRDPYRCAIESAAPDLLTESCRVAFQVATGEQCGGREVTLPSEGLPLCTWVVIGGTEQADYRVGLRPADLPDETPQPSVGVCDAVLVVEARAPAPYAPHVFLLARIDELGQVRYGAISLGGIAIDGCEADLGLACENLPTP